MKWKLVFLGFMTLGIFNLTSIVKAQQQKYQAVYIFNFASFMEWPSEFRSGNFVIGVLGSGAPITSELKVIAGSKKILGQAIEVKEFASPEAVTQCHILFVPASQSGSLSAAIDKANSFSTLIVTDNSGSIAKGAALNFLMSEGKLRFELKIANATKHGLKISPELEKLALKVY